MASNFCSIGDGRNGWRALFNTGKTRSHHCCNSGTFQFLPTLPAAAPPQKVAATFAARMAASRCLQRFGGLGLFLKGEKEVLSTSTRETPSLSFLGFHAQTGLNGQLVTQQSESADTAFASWSYNRSMTVGLPSENIADVHFNSGYRNSR